MITPEMPFDPNYQLTLRQEMQSVAAETVHTVARRIVADTEPTDDMGLSVRKRELQMKISGTPLMWLQVAEPFEDTMQGLRGVNGAPLLAGQERAALRLALPRHSHVDRLSGKYSVYRAIDVAQENDVEQLMPPNRTFGRSILVKHHELLSTVEGIDRALELAAFMMNSMESDLYIWKD